MVGAEERNGKPEDHSTGTTRDQREVNYNAWLELKKEMENLELFLLRINKVEKRSSRTTIFNLNSICAVLFNAEN